MDWQTLDTEIDAYDDLVESACRLVVYDRDNCWESVWSKGKEIQQVFNDRVFYPSKAARDAAWTKFNGIRTKAHKNHNEYRESTSKEVRAEIMRLLGRADHDFVSEIFDATLFVFNQTTKDDMIEKGKLLKQASAMLSENKGKMTFDDKDECFNTIVTVQNHLNAWWEKYKEQSESRRIEYEERQQQRATNQAAFKEKLQSDIALNRERLEKAESDLGKMEASEAKLEEQIENARTEHWKEKAEGWLDELRPKIASVREFIEKLEGWIQRDEEKLEEL